MRRIMLILSAAVMLLTGCTDYRQVRVEGVSLDSFRFKGTSSAVITLEVKVDNPTARTIPWSQWMRSCCGKARNL